MLGDVEVVEFVNRADGFGFVVADVNEPDGVRAGGSATCHLASGAADRGNEAEASKAGESDRGPASQLVRGRNSAEACAWGEGSALAPVPDEALASAL